MTIVGAVSPPGGGFSEPVTQTALRVSRTMWALSASLAHQRPLTSGAFGEPSYSLYAQSRSTPSFTTHGGAGSAQVGHGLVEAAPRGRELRRHRQPRQSRVRFKIAIA